MKIINAKLSLKMRLSFILLLLCLMKANAITYSQNTKINLDVKDENLSVVLDLIKEKTEFKLFYKNSEIDLNRKISLKSDKRKLSDVLTDIFKGTNIMYTVFDKQIILGTAPVKMENKIEAQKSFVIAGQVVDEDGVPLLGITVSVKGSNKAAATDFDGNFKLEVSEGDTVLVKSVGFTTQEIVIKDQKFLKIVLVESLELLDAVVITGYGKVEKRTFTGASTSLQLEELKIDGITDASRMLEGRVAGVNIQNVSGTFGTAPKITIRGSSSIFGNNTPLYVIDGVVQEDVVNVDLTQLTSGNAQTLISSSLAGIDANTIKSVEILKDASATSLYGARARNGVVVITTKEGKRDSPLRVSYSSEVTMTDVPSYNNYDILNSKETVSIFKELESKGYLDLPEVAQARYGGVYYLMAKLTDTYLSNGEFALQNTPEAKNAFLQQYEMGNTDWFKTLFRNAVSQNHSLSFSGGGKNNAYSASVGFYTDPGWSIADNVTRLTTNLKNTFYLSDKLTATLSSIISVRDQLTPGTFESETDNFNGSVTRDFDINPFSFALNTSRALRPRDQNGDLEYYRNNWAPMNILNETANNYMDLSVKDIRFQADIEYKVTDKLKYNVALSNRYVNSTFEHQIKENSNVVGAYNAAETTIVRDDNIFLYSDPNSPNSPPVSVFPQGGIYKKTDYELTSYYLRNSLQFDDKFNDRHEVSLLAGQEMRFVDRKDNRFDGYGIQYDNGLVPFTDPRLLEKLITDGQDLFSLNEEKERTVAFYGKGSYTYDNRYTFSATGRYDGSNRQGRSNSSRWLPTGTVSGKWNVTGEEFMFDVDAVDALQLRASYGLVATPGSATNSLAIYQNQTTDRLLLANRESYLNIEDLQNAELTWEKQYETNIGLDVALFNRGIELTVDVFKRDIFDNVDFVKTSGIGGEYIKTGNNADVDVKGLEFSINTKNISTEHFKWNTGFNFSYIDQEIVKLANQPTVFDLVTQNGGNIEGYPINSLFSFDFKGLDNRGLPTFALPDDSTNEFNEINGADFQESENILDYLVYEGSSNPNITAGLTNNFTYKNWDLSVFISASGGNKIRLNPVFSDEYSDLDVFTKDFSNRWILPGDELVTNIPVIASERLNSEIPNLDKAYNTYNYSTARIADGSFVRLKNISLGYTLDKKLVKKMGLSNLKFKIQATNLFLLYSDSKLNGQDPEFINTGGVAFPIKRQYTFSLNLSI
ncbi:SusC/RagA family TonB-linked outer membrane protein [Wenyingzhuangia sp. 1_MG-2023]|nr:SusC/RagA family TonB-linked outer membrane protein [Wenyingzhuangia sp. 1_MG-2023]